jgi:Ykl077w/Psg1 (Pma1 Stabilization in Golgi)
LVGPSTTSGVSAPSNQPVVSVKSGGALTTLTPSGTALSPSATVSGNSTSGFNSTATSAPACTINNFALGGVLAPFCLPANGSSWIKNNSYPVTWDPSFFWPGYQGKVVIALLYTGKDGSNVITQVVSDSYLIHMLI